MRGPNNCILGLAGLSLATSACVPRRCVEAAAALTVAEPSERSSAPSKASDSAPPSEPATPKPTLEFAPILDGQLILATDYEPLVVADRFRAKQRAAVRSWSQGPLYASPGEVEHRVGRAVDAATLPEALSAYLDQPVALYGARGPICSAELSTLEFLALYETETVFDLLDEGEFDWDAGEVRITDTELFGRIWAAHEVPWLAARLAPEPDCPEDVMDRALWGRSASLTPARVLVPGGAATRELQAARERALFDSKDYAQIEREHAEYIAELEAADPDLVQWESSWAEIVEACPPEANVWTTPEDEPRFVGVFFGHLDACETDGEGFDPFVSYVERFEGSVLGRDPDGHASPNARFDSDGDGQWESYTRVSAWWSVYGRELPHGRARAEVTGDRWDPHHGFGEAPI